MHSGTTSVVMQQRNCLAPGHEWRLCGNPARSGGRTFGWEPYGAMFLWLYRDLPDAQIIRGDAFGNSAVG